MNILWTAGWDSTFRLLYALKNESHPVNLYYIIDPKRRSTRIELKRIDKILKLIKKHYPHLAEKINSLEIYNRKKLEIDDKTEKLYQALKKKYHTGTQYRWLPVFAETKGIHDLELAIVSRPDLETSMSNILSDSLIGKHHDCRLKKKDSISDPDFILFKNFRFPTIHLTKKEIENIAEEQGFMPIMKYTWFCHSPRMGSLPCGKCKPCKIAVECGLGKRLPLISQYLYFINTRHSWNIIKFLRYRKNFA